MKILCTADVHIGRRSSRLPPHVDGRVHSCGLAWRRVVAAALAHQVDLVTVGGDLVDQANRYLEAAGALEHGLKQLADADIPAVIVAGNHDHDVLPRLLDDVGRDTVRLLGRGGRWERFTLERGGARVNVDGWSFPQAHHLSSPLQHYQPAPDEAPTLALVHADLEQPGSKYAPIVLPELRRHPDVLFLLGHVHAPRTILEPGGARAVYPGSPQAMDPGEIGAHGATLLELNDGAFVPQALALSSVRYELLDVPVEGITRPEELDGRLVAAVRSALEAMESGSDHLECVRFRLRLTGATRLGRQLEARLNELAEDLELPCGTLVGSIESFSSRVTPAHELDSIANGVGAPAVVAGLLRGERDDRLNADLRRLVAEVHGSRSFAEVNGGEDDLRELELLGEEELYRAATVLLDELLSQKAPPA